MPNDQQMKLKSQRYQQASVQRRARSGKKDQGSQVGPWLLGIFMFVIVGSTLFQMLNTTATSDDILI